MARLTQLCLATLALLVVATKAAPCNNPHEIVEHTDNQLIDQGNTFDDETMVDGGNWEDEEFGNDGCHPRNPCDDVPTGGHNGGHNGGHTGPTGPIGGQYEDQTGLPGGSTGGAGGSVGGGSDSGSGGGDSLIGISSGYIGTDDINAQGALGDAVDLRGLGINDILQGVDAL